ncbi:unnamed protein product [Chironomus riparius]|uniref:Equilibrative nucleoside transporter 4 n=1 Tax=Chironomus riparius TaxID=315576 RepID=A0A9N9WLM1_9DIPT|nr:unnamed protein product [Chironomus riparius]
MMMEGIDLNDEARTYEPLGSTARNFVDTSPEHNPNPPKDHRNTVYFSFVVAGIGFVLPYNSFIIASDYWIERFPSRTVELDLSTTYIVVAFASVLLNNVFMSIAPLRIRILFGYLVALVTLSFIALCEVAWHVFSTQIAYNVNLAAVSLVALGCTVQQSSFYGFAALLPKKKFTQALMTGESVAGLLVSSNRVITKLLIEDDKISTLIFFLLSIAYVVCSYILHVITIDSPYIRYHLKSCTKIILRPDEEADGSSLYGVLNLENTPPVTAQSHSAPTLSFSNPVYELSNPTCGGDINIESSLIRSGESSMVSSRANSAVTATLNQDSLSSPTGNISGTAYKVEHILAPGPPRLSNLRRIKEGFNDRIKVARSIFPYMICIALAYCVTLSLYPGLESEIISCNLRSWMPVLLMFTFNAADVVGKLLAAVRYSWSRRQLVLMSTLRALLIPLLLLCVAPRKNPTIGGELPAFMFTIALGLSNGLAGSLPMMLASEKVSTPLKEMTGNIMTISYMSGLTVGSLMGYVFENMLGPPITFPCLQYPFIPKNPDEIDTTTIGSTTLLSSSTTTQLITVLSTLTATLVPQSSDISSMDHFTSTIASNMSLSTSTVNVH